MMLDEYVEDLIEKEGILLLCKKCGNTENFNYRETNVCSILHEEAIDDVDVLYPRRYELIDCPICSHELWNREL